MADIINIGSVVTGNMLHRAYTLMNSIKCNKKADTEIDYWLYVELTDTTTEKHCEEYFQELTDEKFRIHIMDTALFRYAIDPQGGNYVLFIRCFFPQVLTHLDKIIHLDTDIICCNPGIEDLWNMDMDDLYIRAVADIPITWCPTFQGDKENTGAPNYFNAGVMLMNLKKIREDGLDDALVRWSINWDHSKLKCLWRDQTILNYVLRDHVELIPGKWNNQVLGVFDKAVPAMDQFTGNEGYATSLDSLEDAVFVHFCGFNKPWSSDAVRSGLKHYPYLNEAQEIWKELQAKYGKK